MRLADKVAIVTGAGSGEVDGLGHLSSDGDRTGLQHGRHRPYEGWKAAQTIKRRAKNSKAHQGACA